MFCNLLTLTADTPESKDQIGQTFFLNSHTHLEDAMKQASYWTLRYANVTVETRDLSWSEAAELCNVVHPSRAPWGFQLTRREDGQTEFHHKGA